MKVERGIPLHPLSIEFLLQKIDKVTSEKKKTIWNLLFYLIQNSFILQINEINLQKLDVNRLNIEILFILIFKHINTGNYEDINLPYFFKRYSWFISAAKIIDNNYLFLAQRFFKNSSISGVELRRINFDGYNFDCSIFSKLKFIQAKFYDVRMNKCIFKNIEFILCDFLNISFESARGDILFSNCTVEKLYLKNPESEHELSTFIFKNCQIKWLEVDSNEKNHSHTINLKFISSDINTLIIKQIIIQDLSFSNCIIRNIKLNDRDLIKKITIEDFSKKGSEFK